KRDRRAPHEQQHPPRRPRSHDPPRPRARAAPWLGPGAAARAGDRRHARRRPGLDLSGALPARAQGAGQGALGRDRERPARPLLRPDRGRAQAARRREGELGEDGAGHRAGARVRRRALDRQIDDQLEAYVAERTARLAADGGPADEAEQRARAEVGSLEAVKDEMRDAHVVSSWLDGLFKDARLAVRRLARQPGFTFVAILTLALGIGGTSAIFSVVKAVLLDPLPYDDPGRLVNVWNELRAENLQRMPGSATVLREL